MAEDMPICPPSSRKNVALALRFHGKMEDTGVDLGYVSPRFVLPKPLQPINTL